MVAHQLVRRRQPDLAASADQAGELVEQGRGHHVGGAEPLGQHPQAITREAEEPLSYREIALRMMGVLGVTVTDPALVEMMRRRVGTCVRRLAQREILQ